MIKGFHVLAIAQKSNPSEDLNTAFIVKNPIIRIIIVVDNVYYGI